MRITPAVRQVAAFIERHRLVMLLVLANLVAVAVFLGFMDPIADFGTLSSGHEIGKDIGDISCGVCM